MPRSFTLDRSTFVAALNDELALHRPLVAVVRIELDRFARIRQVFGPAVAQQVWSELVERIRSRLSTHLQLFPYAEDSFAAVVHAPDTSPDELELLGMSFVEAVSAPVLLAGQPPIAVGSNAGVAAAAMFSDVDALGLLAGAELAIQETAGLGSRRVLVYQAAQDHDPTRIPELFADMLCAVHKEQFKAYFQPVVDLPSRAVVGAEALIRWIHPAHGVLRPLDFLPEAERSGLIRDIDSSIWQQSWSLMASIPSRELLCLAVNLSPADLDFPGLVDKVERHLQNSGLKPEQLVFEVTETALTNDWEHARRRLASIKEFGCRIAVDDFGSGHMFLDRLATGIFDVVKLDRSVIALAGHEDELNFRLLQGVTALMRSLGLTTVAEGIETEEQLQRVIAAGCDRGQGYLFGHPMPGSEYVQFLAAQDSPV